MDKNLLIYVNNEGVQVDVLFEENTFWATQKQIADIFNTTPQNITLHLKRIYSDDEIEFSSTCKEYLQVQKEGKRTIKRNQLFYNLDAIISVGYRINSKRGTQFRQWATQRLKDYLVQGYAINEKRLLETQQEVVYLKSGIRILGRAIEQQSTSKDSEMLKVFAKGLSLLDDYDHQLLDSHGKTETVCLYPTLNEYLELINLMTSEFKSDIFAKPKDENFDSSIHQIQQSFNGKDLYPSLEEKAAVLLYLIVKNHSFVDGNKRIGAACLLCFLNKNGLLYDSDMNPIINNDALAALTLFVAISKTEEMDIIVKLIISVLNRR